MKAKARIVMVDAECGKCGAELIDHNGSYLIDVNQHKELICPECGQSNTLPKWVTDNR